MFVHDLATHLHRPVSVMLSEMSAAEIVDWQAYFEIKQEKEQSARDKAALQARKDRRGR